MKPGTILDGYYKILGELGEGNMGTVYVARQLSMDRVVALKVLHPILAREKPKWAELFLNEARTAAQFSHPNLIQIHDIGAWDTGGTPMLYFAMEYVDGENLGSWLKREGSCDEAMIGRVMTGMANALAYAGVRGVIHRDVKPDNIMITRGGEAKLADFGLIIRSDETAGAAIAGTPTYMSPEAAQGFELDHTSDQYSLGCTLFQMLTGELPYLGATTKQLLEMHIQAAVPDPRDFVECDHRWADLCVRLMAKEPEDRFPDPEELVRAVSAIVEAATAQPPKPLGARRRVANARKARARLAASARERKQDQRRQSAESAPIKIAAEQEKVHDPVADAVLWPFRKGWDILQATPGWTLWLLGHILAISLTVGAYILDKIIWCLPFVRAFFWWLVPKLAQVYFIPVALTWRLRIDGGHAFLLEAREQRSRIIAGFLTGRLLPGVWRMTDKRWLPHLAMASRQWFRQTIAFFLERITLARALTAEAKARAIQRRIHLSIDHPGEGCAMGIDRSRRGHCDPEIVVAARAAKAAILPVACSASPGWLFGRSRLRHLIPAPFATIHLVFAPPIEVGERDNASVSQEVSDTLVDIQHYCDRVAGLRNADPIRE